jgi:hypothetical protein
VELASLEVQGPLRFLAHTLFTSAQRSEVLSGLGRVVEQVNDNLTGRFFVNSYIEENRTVKGFFRGGL